MTNVTKIARGDFLGMNGNYAAGVLEGLAHFVPEAARRLERGQGPRRGLSGVQ